MEDSIKSKTQLKKEADDKQQFGIEISNLPNHKIKELSLSDEIIEAIIFYKEIKKNNVSATNQLITACADGQARLYDTSNGKSLRSFNASGDFLYSLSISLDGKQLLASGQSGVLRLWNVEDGKLITEWK